MRIFFDTEEIQTGTRWRQKLAEALRQSRCIVCVWSPLYFRSKWCVSEWMTFVRREDLAKRELVASASFCDGKSFPKAALDTTWVDFSEFASTFPTFWNTEPAVTFEKGFDCDPSLALSRRKFAMPRPSMAPSARGGAR